MRKLLFDILHMKRESNAFLFTEVDIYRSLKTMSETMCSTGVSVSCLPSRFHHKYPPHSK